MPPNQSAYRKCHSTETALFSNIIEELDEGNLVLLTMLDLSAAFDCVDHEILLKRLERSYGIQSIAHSWIKSYLTDRTQRVHHNGQISHRGKMYYGVPQEFVLEPLLFLLYTADINDIVDNHSLRSHYYADGIQLQTPCTPTSSQQQLARDKTVRCIDDINS